MNPLSFRSLGFLALVAMCFSVAQPAISQTLTEQHNLAPDSAASSDVNGARTSANSNTSNEELLKELGQMRARIEQLEAQLKAKSGSTGESSSQQAQPAVQSVSLTTTAKPTPPQTGDQTQPKKPEPAAPFAYADWTWLNGTPRNKDAVRDSKFFTPEIRFDTHYIHSFNNPRDDSMGGSTEVFRSNEVQLEQISFGGDFHWQNVRGRVLTMNGMFGVTTPRNDASVGLGQWDLRGAYKYVSEAYGGYHFDVNHGLNIDAGIFVSYIGLFSYYNFDNWAYQPSYVSSNTPWFF